MKTQRFIAAISIVSVTGLLLAGCAGRTGPSEASAGAAASDVEVAEANSYWDACASFLDEATVDALLEEGLVPASVDYQDKISEDTGPMGRFVLSGGIACGWKDPGGSLSVLYAYGPLSADQTVTEKERIVKKGSVPSEGSTYDRYTHYDGYPGGFAFGDGVWAYALDNGGGDMLDQVVANAPKF